TSGFGLCATWQRGHSGQECGGLRGSSVSELEPPGGTEELQPGNKMAKCATPGNLPGLWRISKYFWPHARKHPGLIVIAFLALLAEVGLRLMEPWPLKFVFDRILERGRPGRLAFLPDLKGVDPMIAVAW